MDQQLKPKPYRGPYLFVNSSTDKPTRSRADNYIVSSHVSKAHRKWSRDEKLKRLNESAGRAVAQKSILPADRPIQAFAPLASPDQGDGSTALGSGHTFSVSAQSRSRILPQRRAAGSALGDEGSQHGFHLESSQEHDDHQQAAPLQTWKQYSGPVTQPSLAFWKGNSDPFSVAAVPLAPWHHEIIRQAQRFLVFAAWPDKASAVFRAPIADTANSHIHIQHILADEAEIHAILASGYQVVADTSQGKSEAALTKGLAHKNKVVALLRQKLPRMGFSEKVATLIRLLISLDFQAGDYTAALIHLRGLRAISASIPGMLSHIQELLLVSDVWIALSLLKKPEISPAQYNPGPRQQQAFDIALRLLESDNASFVSGDVETRPRGGSVLTSPTFALLDAAYEIINTKTVMDKIKDPVLQQEVVWWLHRRATAVSGFLVTAYVEATESAPSPKSDHATHAIKTVNGVACLCAILFMNLRFVDYPSNYDFSKTFQTIESTLRSMKTCLTESVPQSFDEVYFWVLFMCAMGTDVYSARGNTLYSHWPVSEFHRVCKRLNVVGAIAITARLRQFQYYSEMDAFIQELAADLGESRNGPIISWSRWCLLLDHYVP